MSLARQLRRKADRQSVKDVLKEQHRQHMNSQADLVSVLCCASAIAIQRRHPKWNKAILQHIKDIHQILTDMNHNGLDPDEVRRVLKEETGIDYDMGR